jgi:uncharacterized protein DUF4231
MLRFRRARASDLRQAIKAHLETVPADAPIRTVLASPDIETRLAQFEWADAMAVKEQRSYRRFRMLSLWATMLGTVVGALFLLPIEQSIDGWPRTAFQVLQAAALVLALAATIWIGMRQQVGQWLKARALAERMRADLFRAVMRAGAEGNRLLAPALACFRDAHLDRQLAFYTERGERYRKSAGNSSPYRMTGYVLLAVAVALGSVGIINLAARLDWWPLIEIAMQWLRVEHPERWQLGLGAMASSILAFASARSFMDLDDRNASFYANTAAQLQRLRTTDLVDAEAAAAAANVSEVLEFCEKVQTLLDTEHLAWTFTRPAEPPPADGNAGR